MTKPKMEIQARENLTYQGFEVYLPLWVDLKRQQGRWKKVQSAMFPRYLFVRPTYTEQTLSPIRSTRGVSQIVRFGVETAWISDGLIEEIRTLEAFRQSQDHVLKPFKEGDKVLVLDGPFKGVSAEVFACGQQRVILLLQMLGKTQQLEFEASLCQLQ